MTTVLLVVAAAVLGLATWQNHRYWKIRRERTEDRQPLIYSSRSFHSATLIKLEAESSRERELAVLRALQEAIAGPGGGIVVYAGLVGLTMAPSSQIENDWSGVMIAQFPSREAFDRTRSSPELQRLLDDCERSYTLGFRRPVLMNLMIPIGLGVMRLRDIVLRREPILPFQPVSDDEALPPLLEKREELKRLDTYRDVREDAVVIVNFLLPGDSKQRKADRAYTGEMTRGMAEGGYGPMHMGPAVVVEGESNFKMFAAVYYPGIDHMHAMLGSRFMNRIASDKQLGDTLAVATIPVLTKLSQ